MFSVQSSSVNENKVQYAVDRIEEGSIAVCQNLATEEIVEIKTKLLPKGIHDGSILDYENGKYKINLDEERIIRERVRKKMNEIFDE